MRVAGRPSSIEAVDRGAVGVAVQEQRDAVLAHDVLHGGLVHVHDVVGLRRDLGGAELPQVGGDLAALGERFREEVALPCRIAQRAAQAHVARVVGAEQVAVREQHGAAVEIDALVVAEQPAAGRGAEPRPDQEVAVAVHQASTARPHA